MTLKPSLLAVIGAFCALMGILSPLDNTFMVCGAYEAQNNLNSFDDFNGLDAHVITLSANSFERLTQASTGATSGDWFVLFYSTSCDVYDAVDPIWKQLARNFAGAINFAEVDTSKNPELLERFDVKQDPTLLYFSKGRMHLFKGNIVDFAEMRDFVQTIRTNAKDPGGGRGIPVPSVVVPAQYWFFFIFAVGTFLLYLLYHNRNLFVGSGQRKKE